MDRLKGPQEAFISHLEQLVERQDRGALASLRRGLGRPPGAAPEMYPYVVPYLPGAWAEEPYYLVASLFALWHQGKSGPAGGDLPSNLGASFARLAPPGADNREAVERRFVALLNCHPDDLPEHLRHAVSLLKAKDVPVDWARLLRDIRGWDSDSRWVQRAWARAFWGQAPAIGAQAPAAAGQDEVSGPPDNE